ncbi:MAG: hypothetical protein ACR2FG_11330 [Marmoricola sp.]
MTEGEKSERDLSPEERAERRRRLARLFGEVLPEQTADDRDDRPSESDDAWLRAQVPPHHG